MHANVDIEAQRQEPVVFHLTGKRTGSNLDDVNGLRPALLAGYRDLTLLRYDFPVVLTDEAGVTPVRSLSSVIDSLLQSIAPPGMTSERLRKLVLRIEREIRVLVAQGTTGNLSDLWDEAAERLAASIGAAFEKNVTIARAALDTDGEVLDCNAQVAARLVTHMWSAVQEDKARSFRTTTSRLAVKLADILRADFMRSAAGRGVESLQAAIGPAHHALFDFDTMSRLLPRASAREALPDSRRRRVEWALKVLKEQRFFATPAAQTRPEHAAEPYDFKFVSCADAIAAFRARLPEMIELVKAIAVAELEVDGLFVESRHDAYFEGFDAGALAPADMAMFPDYLVSLSGHGEAEHAGLIEALSSGVPLKVIVDVPDLLQEPSGGDGMFASGLRGTQLASMATALSEVFVLQSASSNLYQMRDRLMRGLTFAGPALFSVFSGAGDDSSLPPYLSAAAAMQSRAFPAFTFDPAAGADLATRFSLEDNPQPERDWTVQRFEYADEDFQRVSLELEFTFADFLASDRRYARHFARATCADWNARMVPVADWLRQGTAAVPNTMPFVFAVDDDDLLQRVIVDDKAIQAARRCLEVWHRLQEFGGVHSSHAERLLAREKAAWEEEKQREIESLKAKAAPPAAPAAAAETAAPAATPAAAAPAAPAAAPAEPERDPDEPYIETIRCSTCNECTQINDRMFVYNDNKQAYIADPDAGTYRQLVEAAESCQIGIIHPGKPRNPNEPGLEELTERAAAFA